MLLILYWSPETFLLSKAYLFVSCMSSVSALNDGSYCGASLVASGGEGKAPRYALIA
jgi:hypothetical protein